MSWWWFSAKDRDTPKTARPYMPAWMRGRTLYRAAWIAIKRRKPAVQQLATLAREDKSIGWSMNSPIARREQQSDIGEKA